jgi:hypothetical protein
MTVMRWTFLSAFLALAPALAAQQIPALLSLSEPAAAAHPELVKQRAALLETRSRLREKNKQQKQECSAVEEGTAAEASCRSKLSELDAKLKTHIEDSDRFNAAVRLAEASLPPSGGLLSESAAELTAIFNRVAKELNLPKGPATDRPLAAKNCSTYFNGVAAALSRAGRPSWQGDFQNLNADGIAARLHELSQNGGNWASIDISEAQTLASRGAVVVGASPLDSSGFGHIGFAIPLPPGLDASRFSGTGPFVRDGNEHVPARDPKLYPSTWGAVKASKAFQLTRTRWYVFVPSKP